MIVNDELRYWMKEYKKQFGDIVPLMQIRSSVTNEHLIESIQKCLNDNVDYLPKIYGYDSEDPNKNY